MTTLIVEQFNITDIVDFLNDVTDLSWLDKSVYEAIGEELILNAEDRFEKEVDPDGNKWTPLSDKYAKRKEKKLGGDTKILKYSGNLGNLLRYQANDFGLKFGSDRKYARTHQEGDSSRNIPQRKFIGLSDDDKESIRDTVKEAFDEWVAQRS